MQINPINQDMNVTFRQGDITSGALINLGSCVADFDQNLHSTAYSYHMLPPSIQKISQSQERERIVNCGSVSIEIYDHREQIGYVVLNFLHDKIGPNGTSQFSTQVVTRDLKGKPLCRPFSPPETHNFDLKKGPVEVSVELNGQKFEAFVY